MIHKAFTIGFAENGLVLIQHSLDDEDMIQTRIEPSCETLLQSLGRKLRSAYLEYSDYCEAYGLELPLEGDGFGPEVMLADCMKSVVILPVDKSNLEFESMKKSGLVDGPKVEFDKSSNKIYIKKRRS